MASRNSLVVLVLAGAVFVAMAATLSGGSATGGYTYKTYCATCHGAQGKGDGQLAKILTVKPADLTRIAARNDGKFDADQVRARIDGRTAMLPHGPSDMPIWGDAFALSEQTGGEAAVRQRIDDLVDYLRTLQAAEK